MGQVTSDATGEPTGGVAFAQLAGLASALARPLDRFGDSAWQGATLTPSEMRTLCASPHFGRPVRAVVTRALVGAEFDIPAGRLFALAGQPGGRLALQLVCAPVGELEQAGLLVAAAVLHSAILRTTAKADRQRVRLALGAAAFTVATQEAPVLYPGLAPRGAGTLPAAILSAGADEEEMRRGFVRFGLAALLRLTGTVAPGVERLVERRLPPDLLAPLGGSPPELDCDLIVKLMRRRMPSWSATIG